MAGTLYPTCNRYFWPARYSASTADRDEIRAHISENVLPQWQVVEDRLGEDGPWMLGQRFSAADIYLQMITTWHQSPAELLGRFPRVRELARGVMGRDTCRQANRAHGFSSGFESDR